MNRLAAILTAILLTACAAEEPRAVAAFDPTFRAYGTTMFAYTPVGFGGQYTEELLRVREIAKTDDAEEQFLEYLESDDPGIRLYGMYGLFIIESPKYGAAVEVLIQDDSPVNVGGGCLISTGITSEVAAGFAAYWSYIQQRHEDGD